jgi:hypothetical protein
LLVSEKTLLTSKIDYLTIYLKIFDCVEKVADFKKKKVLPNLPLIHRSEREREREREKERERERERKKERERERERIHRCK